MENKSTSINVSEKDRQIIKSVLPLLIVIVLFVLVGKFGVSQISGLRNKIAEAKKVESTLSQKYNILRSIEAVSALGSTQALIALPKSNPAISVQAQVKSLAAQNLLILESLKSSGSSSELELSSVTTSMELSGPKEGVVAFVKAIETIAPITIVDKVSFSESGSEIKAEVSLRTYFAPLPKTIPTVNQAVTDLTPSERTLLSQIELLSQPALSDLTVATQSAYNPNPFGL